MRIYISGPITGVEPFIAFRMFSNAEWKIQQLGHIAVNPLKIGFNLPKDFTHQDYMDIDMVILEKMDAILMLDGWEESRGCTREFGYASRTDLPIFYSLNEIPENK